MNKKKYFICCGLCKVNFDNHEDMLKHFKSEEHIKALTDPIKVMEVNFDSQSNILRKVSMDDDNE